jgi:hypothetical protein
VQGLPESLIGGSSKKISVLETIAEKESIGSSIYEFTN